ncbi:L-rhamnose/proton symporter RhaT [Tamlana sp. 2201CG12-4]|uniref:L-rhamnose/proton symporter RhaT n=1 Tax=Tamlana sp. 2201CG12-4 TaxID=3112582 RepID=UPI002DB6B100|nr:L-rhamnose/proton symporter RhaT [Tamlana sp. 2201CG12-4]MEC3907857.1 L-rhamnose/proton symporter RhaT [Tamlana sp. 2201CG12-4]
MASNPILGTLLHAIGGVSASTCYLPFEKVKKWSWNSYWLVQASFAWLVFPLIVGYLTIPNLWGVYEEASNSVIINTIVLGAVYGFGGMAFGYAIKYIGFSLTYTIAIGLSAVLGTIVPLIIHGTLMEQFTKSGGLVVLFGLLLALFGVAICGCAGYKKDNDLKLAKAGNLGSFNLKKGLMLAVFAGVFSSIFGISLELGAPVAEIAGKYGAGHFEGNANLLLSTLGAFITNFVWFTVASIRQKTIGELVAIKTLGVSIWFRNLFLSILTGGLWYFQFFFYGLGHINMGKFKFVSWAVHMSMLIFFSYLVGVLMKEWKEVGKSTYTTLVLGLLILVISFVVITYGGMVEN